MKKNGEKIALDKIINKKRPKACLFNGKNILCQ